MIIGDIYEKWERLPDDVRAVVENQLNGTVMELQDVELFKLAQAVMRDKATQPEMDKIQCVLEAALLAQLMSLQQVGEALGPEHAEAIADQVKPIREYLDRRTGPVTKDTLTQGFAMVKWAMEAMWRKLEELMNAPEPEPAQAQSSVSEEPAEATETEDEDEEEDPQPHPRGPARRRH